MNDDKRVIKRPNVIIKRSCVKREDTLLPCDKRCHNYCFYCIKKYNAQLSRDVYVCTQHLKPIYIDEIVDCSHYTIDRNFSDFIEDSSKKSEVLEETIMKQEFPKRQRKITYFAGIVEDDKMVKIAKRNGSKMTDAEFEKLQEEKRIQKKIQAAKEYEEYQKYLETLGSRKKELRNDQDKFDFIEDSNKKSIESKIKRDPNKKVKFGF